MRRELDIESDVPLPGPRGPRVESSRKAHKMQPGDSIFTSDHSEVETLRRTIYALGGKARSRKCIERGEMGWRVWRSV